ncbi:MAG: hypothetical protein LBL36_04450 [Clostridiales Family XIII bacterium]|jgi:hypothetical protein|nr:hypothetical protein [Clostridiales Family XIII bacterium]
MSNIKRELYRGAVLFAAIFSVVTIISSVIQLINGTESDSNFHIILRAMITLIGVTAFWMSWKASFRVEALNVIVPYVVTIAMVFATVFFSGFFVELHPNAYRDIFLNYTVVFAIVTVIIRIVARISTKKSK